MVVDPSEKRSFAGGSVAARGWWSMGAVGVHVGIDRDAERRQSGAQQKEVDAPLGREGLEDAAALGVDVEHGAAEFDAGAAPHVTHERFEGMLEQVVVKIPHAIAAGGIGGEATLHGGEGFVQAEDEPVIVPDDGHARGRPAEEQVFERAGRMGDETGAAIERLWMRELVHVMRAREQQKKPA